MCYLSRRSALVALVGALVLALALPGTALAGPMHGDFRGRAWLPGEESLEQTLASQSRGLIRPFLWPSHLAAPLASVRRLGTASPSGRADTAGSFLVEYRSRDGNTFLRFGADRPSTVPAGASQTLFVRGTLPAVLVEGTGSAAGDLWIRWSEPGTWQPAGSGGPALAAVDYEVHARGLTKGEAEGFVEGLVALNGPWAYVRVSLILLIGPLRWPGMAHLR